MVRKEVVGIDSVKTEFMPVFPGIQRIYGMSEGADAETGQFLYEIFIELFLRNGDGPRMLFPGKAGDIAEICHRIPDFRYCGTLLKNRPEG